MKLSTGKEIEVVENKILKLKNVISREFGSQDANEIQRITHLFDAYVKSHRLTPYGPMVILARTEFERGVITQKNTMLVQVRETVDKIEAPYSFTELVRVENCLMARYKGDLASLPMVYSKLQVYSFEHDIKLKDGTYTVFVEQSSPEKILADVFVETQA
jgi:hypothetical protein